jgi:hypothetical protein
MGTAIANITLTLCVIGACWGVIQTFVGLRAKSRLHNEIVMRAMLDAHLREILKRATQKDFDPEVLAAAIAEIEAAAKTLSEKDQRLIESGLNQPSRVGTRRYVRDILTAA